MAAVLLYHGDVVDAGRVPRRRDLLRHQRLPDPALLLAGAKHGRHGVPQVLGPAGRRLLPALFALLVAVAVAWLVWHQEVARIQAIASLGYVAGTVIVGRSYVGALGRPSPLRHLWSLAVEGQFYLVWPVALALLVRVTAVGARRWSSHAGVMTGWALRGAALFKAGHDPLLYYYGTDTRAAGVLLGPALAIAAPPWSLRPTSGDRRRLLSLVGSSAWSASGGCACQRRFDPFVYRGGFVLIDLCAGVIAVLVHPGVTGVGRGGRRARLVRWCGSAGSTASTCGTGRSSC